MIFNDDPNAPMLVVRDASGTGTTPLSVPWPAPQQVDFKTRMEINDMLDEDPTAQDVIDALRIALMAQKDPAEAIKIVNMLVDFAPETNSNRGIDLLLRLISEASLKVSMVDA